MSQNLIELYFLIKVSDSVNDALIEWSQKIKQERKLKVVLMTVQQWMVQHEDPNSRKKSLRRLGDMIVRSVYAFDETFPARAKDQLQCELGKVSFARATFNEDMLLEFYDRFRTIQQQIPACHLCRFKATQRRFLDVKAIDLYSETQRKTVSAHKGYVKQAERLDEAAADTSNDPKCRWCDRLGDSVIVLQSPRRAVLVTADGAFIPFGRILGQNVALLPSLASLRAKAMANRDDGQEVL